MRIAQSAHVQDFQLRFASESAALAILLGGDDLAGAAALRLIVMAEGSLERQVPRPFAPAALITLRDCGDAVPARAQQLSCAGW